MAEKDTRDDTKAGDKSDAPKPEEKTGTAQEAPKTSVPAATKKAGPKKKSVAKKKSEPRKKSVRKSAADAGAATVGASAAKTAGAPAPSAQKPRKVAPAKPVSTKAGLLPWVVLASAIAGIAYLYDHPQTGTTSKDEETTRPDTSALAPEPSIVQETVKEESASTDRAIESSIIEVEQTAPVSPGDTSLQGQADPTPASDMADGGDVDSSAKPQEPITPTPVAQPVPEPQSMTASEQPTESSQEKQTSGEPVAEPEEATTTAPVDPREARRQEMREAHERMLSGRHHAPTRTSPYPYYNPGWAPRPYPMPGYGNTPKSTSP
ncbi:MAG: hypothetical protein U9R74_15865 [Pseudomonadota bacterium]|nr:hypothetical protein [Pseudomonadota bacterium]